MDDVYIGEHLESVERLMAIPEGRGKGSMERGGTFSKGTVEAPLMVRADVGAGDKDAGALSEHVHRSRLRG